MSFFVRIFLSAISILLAINTFGSEVHNMSAYPLENSASEQERLDKQAQLLAHPQFGVLIKKSKRCLEIGCGVGSNIPVARAFNSNIEFVGIDLNPTSVALAKERYADDRTSFQTLDIHALDQLKALGPFDMIFSRLTLWSVGKDWRSVLPRIKELLTSGGQFYAYEPDDTYLAFLPERSALNDLIKRWQTKTTSAGLNPFIGRELHSALVAAGFSDVTTVLDAKVTAGNNPDQYSKCAENLMKIFTSKGPENLGYAPGSEEWNQAISAFRNIEEGNLILEAYFVSTGTAK